MGGSGSTRWQLHTKKLTAEECLELSVTSLRKRVPRDVWDNQQRYAGGFSWMRGQYLVGSIRYVLDWPAEDKPRLWLEHGGKQAYPVALTSTPCNYGGVRWWFTCPRLSCRRRVAKLYLAHGSSFYMCRHCLDLSYTSAQEAHRERLAGLGELIGVLDRLTKLELLERKWKKARGKRKERLWERMLKVM